MNSFRSESIEQQRSKSLGNSARFSIVDKIQLRRRRSERKNKSNRNDSNFYTEKVIPLGTIVDFQKRPFSQRVVTDRSIDIRRKIQDQYREKKVCGKCCSLI